MTTAIARTALRLDDSAGLPRGPRSRSTRLRPFGVLAAALTLGVLTLPGECRAGGIVLSAPDLTAAPGSSGSFLVLLTDTDPSGSPAYRVMADSFELDLSGAPGVTFTGVAIPGAGATPYIYAVSTANQLGIPLYTSPTNPFPTTDFTAADSGYASGTYPGYTTVNPGDVFALGLVSYSIAPTAPPGAIASIGFVAAGTSLSDDTGAAISFTTTGGSITLVASTPEPSSWMLSMTAIGIVLLSLVWRRRAVSPNRAA
jgi:hypothetical protein